MPVNLVNLQDQIARLRAANRTGMVMLVDDVAELIALSEGQRSLARRALIALIEHDLARIRACCERIVGKENGP